MILAPVGAEKSIKSVVAVKLDSRQLDSWTGKERKQLNSLTN